MVEDSYEKDYAEILELFKANWAEMQEIMAWQKKHAHEHEHIGKEELEEIAKVEREGVRGMEGVDGSYTGVGDTVRVRAEDLNTKNAMVVLQLCHFRCLHDPDPYNENHSN